MSLQGKKTKDQFQRASKVIPYGVNSNFRYWGENDTLIIEKGKGASIWDVDGKEYIDYRLGFGPIILGHADPTVEARVQEAIKSGTIFAWSTPLEISVAERITRMCKIDKVRLTNTGTEACMHALRLARAYTGREKYIKFEGQYHGMADYFMFSTASSPKGALGSRRSPIPAAATSGIPRDISRYVFCLPFNDFERLEEIVEARWQDLAAIFVEPILGNAAGIMPRPGFLEKIRELCDKYGIVMVMDEVKTGFRVANGGAQEYFNVQGDIVTYAKSMGNGFPIAAFGGKDEVMMTIEPGAVAHGGTYSGNIVGTAAADATLEILENQPILEDIFRNGKILIDGISDILTEAGIPHHMTGVPSMFGFILGTDEEPRDFRDYADGDHALYEKLATELIHRGVQPDVDGHEPWFICHSHDAEVISRTLSIFNDTVKEVKR
ncbi:MAG: glutamate-1-semialdehyde 2,1-aminomutase [Anaerolineaceae bacterium]|nr:glutamate-1-semialdehyde 2,1-aminomutase [Anaerolineaceae bacterium]